jgi:hypothetical protein
MTTKQQYADLTQAWAEGATIEISGNGDIYYSSPAGDMPLYYESSYYRIKPKPEVKVFYLTVDSKSISFIKAYSTEYNSTNVKVTFKDEELTNIEIIK